MQIPVHHVMSMLLSLLRVICKTGSCIYEEFVATEGMDRKVYWWRRQKLAMYKQPGDKDELVCATSVC